MKSAVTFFRKQLGYKGRTEHNGRGMYEMELNRVAMTSDVETKVRSLVDKWTSKDMVEKVEEDDRFVCVTLNDQLFDETYLTKYTGIRQSYRTLCLNKQHGTIGVVMAR